MKLQTFDANHPFDRVTFIGDLHIAKVLPHSSRESARLAKSFRHLQMVELLEGFKNDCIVSLGDFFDSFTVTNNDFYRASTLAERFHIILGGNHDYSQDASKVSALSDLQSSRSSLLVADSELTKVEIPTRRGSVWLYLFPHAPTQTIMGERLEELLYSVQRDPPPADSILCLHANYNRGYSDAGEIENNFSEEWANKLSPYFSYIITGHEHNHKSAPAELVHLIGSPYPMTFGEMQDKYVMHFSPEEGLSKTQTWSREKWYLSVTPQEFWEIPLGREVDFIEIVGKIRVEEVSSVAKKRNELLQAGKVLAIKNSTESEVFHLSKDSKAQIDSWESCARARAEKDGLVDLFNDTYKSWREGATCI